MSLAIGIALLLISLAAAWRLARIPSEVSSADSDTVRHRKNREALYEAARQHQRDAERAE